MRSCPHCGEKIQDEAIVCRYCGNDVEPPAWVAKMERCPYCAEWIERERPVCPYCRRTVRQRAGRLEPAEAPALAAVDASEEDDLEYEPTEVKLRARLFERPGAMPPGPLTPVEAPVELKAEVERSSRLSFLSPSVLIWGGSGLFLAVALGAAGFFFLRGPWADPGTMAAAPSPTPRLLPTLTLPPPPTQTPLAQPTEPAPTPTPESSCLAWDEVTLEDEGETVCVTGMMRRWFASGGLPFVAIFSEEAGTFIIVDREQVYPEIRAGDCIMVTGVVEVMGGTRPFIDAAGELETCAAPEAGTTP